MKKESLETAKELIISTIEKSNIETIDKIELLLNLYHFLDNYDEDIKILTKKSR